MTEARKVAILTPLGAPMEAVVLGSLMRLVLTTIAAGIDIVFITMTGGPLAKIRNLLAQRGLGMDGVTHLFWADGDMVFPADVLLRLLAWRRPVMSGLYMQRSPSTMTHHETGLPGPMAIQPHLYWKNHRDKRLGENPKDNWRSRLLWNDLMAVDGVGAGCLLEEREVYDNIAKPWFHNPLTDDGFRTVVGEDLWHCDQLALAGYEILVDTNISGIMHLAEAATGAPGQYYAVKSDGRPPA